MTESEMKIALVECGKKKRDLIAEIKKRYREQLDDSYLCKVFLEYDGQPKAERVKIEIAEIICDWKRGKSNG